MAQESSTVRGSGATEGYSGSAGRGGAAGTASTSGQSSGIVDRVRERASAGLANQKERATEGLGSVADAVRQTTQQLRDQRHETAAQYVEQAASQIDRFSDMLRRKDVGELVEDAQRLARRQPALFIGSAFGIGLIGARFLKSTPPDRSMERAHPATARAPYRQDDSASRVQGLPSNRVAAPEEPFNG